MKSIGKQQVVGGRRKGGAKLRRKGTASLLPDMPQNQVKGMGPSTSTYKSKNKGTPKGKAKVGVTNPIQKGMRTPNTPLGNPLSRSGKKSGGRSGIKSSSRSGLSTRKANRPMGNPVTDYVDPGPYMDLSNQGMARPATNPWQRSAFAEQMEKWRRRQTTPYVPRSGITALAGFRPKGAMTANLTPPRRTRGY